VAVSSMRERPRITLKIAQTLDGRIATRTGHSRWISSPASRAVGHALRASHDAVMVGIGTVLVDDPELTVRHVAGTNPTRVIVDSALRLPIDAAVLRENGARVIVVTLARGDTAPAEAIRRTGAEVLTVPESDGRVNLAIAFQELRERGIRSLLVEGGAQIATEVIRKQLVDELVLFIAPKILGSGIDALGDLGVIDMSQAVQFSSSSVEVLDDDIVFRGEPIWSA
jgi:riboflavin-specific deaminase-like protein